MSKSRKGQLIGGATTLMINAQRICSGKRSGDAVLDKEREGDSQPGHRKAVFARRLKFGEVGFENSLIGVITAIRPGNQVAGENWFAGIGFDQMKNQISRAGRRRREVVADVQFSQAARIISDHCALGHTRQIAGLVDVDDRAEPID